MRLVWLDGGTCCDVNRKLIRRDLLKQVSDVEIPGSDLTDDMSYRGKSGL